MYHCWACGSPCLSAPPVTCSTCHTQHWKNPKPTAGALVMRDGRLLLLRRTIQPWLNHWDIPGGFCEFEEHPASAAIRETKEETGLEIRITGFLGIWMDAYAEDGSTTDEVAMNTYYHAIAPQGLARPAHEAAEVRWFDPNQLPERLAFWGHTQHVLAAWRAAVREGRTVTPLPDHPPTAN